MKQMMGYVKEEPNAAAGSSVLILAMIISDPAVFVIIVCGKKLSRLSKEEFETLHHRIINMVKYESLHTKDLLLKLNGIKKEKAWKVIEFLQAENKIEMDSSGMVQLKYSLNDPPMIIWVYRLTVAASSLLMTEHSCVP